MKLLRASAVLSAVVVSWLSFNTSVKAQEADYTCFMKTNSGRIIDLSQSVCHSTKPAAPVLATADKKFIADYKRQVMQYPDVRDDLLASAKQSPEPSIDQAKDVCENLRSGLSLQDIRENQSGEMLERDEAVNAKIINTLAPKYYCPEVKQ
jgi:hypothetical protein